LIRKVTISTGLGILSVLIVLLIIGFNSMLEKGVERSPLKALNNEINDIAFQNRLYTYQDSLLSFDDIVIVDIDDASIKALGRVQLWPRLYEAEVIKYLSSSGAKNILLDALYTEPDTLSDIYSQLLERAGFQNSDMILSALSTDSILAAAINDAGNVYLPLFDDEQHTGLPADTSLFFQEATVLKADSASVADFIRLDNLTPPIPILAKASKNIGAINIPSQSDGVVRYYPILQKLPDENNTGREKLIGNFTFQYLLDYFNQPKKCIVINKDLISLCNYKSIPIRPDGSFRINWPGNEETFRIISFHKVLDKLVPAEFFEDKIIFIGTSAAGLQDNKTTPLAQKIPGVQVHAAALLNMYNQSFLNEPPVLTLVPFLLVLATALSLIFISIKPIYSFLVFIIVAFMELFAYWLVIFDSFALILPVGTFIILTLVTFIVGVIYRYITEERQKKMLKGAFASYVEPEVVDLIMKNRHSLKLGGEKKELTVLFSDIRGFTTFSESMDPQDLVSFLNDYLDRMSQIIFRQKGTIDKFIGDAIMAIYGAPVSQPNNATRACLTAVDMIKELERINSEQGHTNKSDALNIGIGINTGPMTVGNIGSKKRFDYTVIGDSVNLAARLEGLNKYFGTQILVSKDTLEKTDSDLFTTREIANVAVKGKDKAIKVYELINPEKKKQEGYMNFFEAYNQGLASYYKQSFSAAAGHFKKALEIYAGDKASSIYLERCNYYVDHPEDFTFAFKMDVK